MSVKGSSQSIHTVIQVFLGWQIAILEMAVSRCVENAFTSSSCLGGPIVFIWAGGRRPIADGMMKQNYLVLCTPNNIFTYWTSTQPPWRMDLCSQNNDKRCKVISFGHSGLSQNNLIALIYGWYLNLVVKSRSNPVNTIKLTTERRNFVKSVVKNG